MHSIVMFHAVFLVWWKNEICECLNIYYFLCIIHGQDKLIHWKCYLIINVGLPSQTYVGRVKLPSTVSRLTAHCSWDVFDFVICEFGKEYGVIHNTEYPYWNQMVLGIAIWLKFELTPHARQLNIQLFELWFCASATKQTFLNLKQILGTALARY